MTNTAMTNTAMTNTARTTTPIDPTADDPTGAPLLAADDPRARFAAAVSIGGRTLAAVAPDQFDLATPCARFDVRTLAGHLVAVLQRVACMGRGGTAHDTPDLVTGVADEGWHDAWTEAAHDVAAVWTDPELLGRTFTLPWAELPGAALLAMYTNEVVVHTWDLAVATGQDPQWDDAVIETAMEAMRVGLPAEGRGANFEAVRAAMPPEFQDWEFPFADVVDVAADASPIDRLVAWNGRDPELHRTGSSTLEQ